MKYHTKLHYSAVFPRGRNNKKNRFHFSHNFDFPTIKFITQKTQVSILSEEKKLPFSSINHHLTLMNFANQQALGESDSVLKIHFKRKLPLGTGKLKCFHRFHALCHMAEH